MSGKRNVEHRKTRGEAGSASSVTEILYNPVDGTSEGLKLQVTPVLAVAIAVDAVSRVRMRERTDRSNGQLVLALLGRMSLSHAEAGYPTAVGARVALGRARNTVQASKKLSHALERAEREFLNIFEIENGVAPAPDQKAAKKKRAARSRRPPVSKSEAAELVKIAGLFARYRQTDSEGERHNAETELLKRYDPIIDGHVSQFSGDDRTDALDTAMEAFEHVAMTADLAQQDFAITLDDALSRDLGSSTTVERPG